MHSTCPSSPHGREELPASTCSRSIRMRSIGKFNANVMVQWRVEVSIHLCCCNYQPNVAVLASECWLKSDPSSELNVAFTSFHALQLGRRTPPVHRFSPHSGAVLCQYCAACRSRI
ncbi:hypothetical protein CEXT_116291 [Caerostris extrusa]|uniref:Uncharacterized protein n=1 Tax=Caerostris extrusa TaxID=172846 RepID=A0AAV4SN84_CAEEX|nr:hypothetical protein CEXT_116291 [Caerostris extrusa]